jgi:hypothetical protein
MRDRGEKMITMPTILFIYLIYCLTSKDEHVDEPIVMWRD